MYLYILPVGYLAFALKRTVFVDVMYTKYYTEVLRVPCPVSCHNECANGKLIANVALYCKAGTVRCKSIQSTRKIICLLVSSNFLAQVLSVIYSLASNY